jgi:hypothetical protein
MKKVRKTYSSKANGKCGIILDVFLLFMLSLSSCDEANHNGEFYSIFGLPHNAEVYQNWEKRKNGEKTRIVRFSLENGKTRYLREGVTSNGELCFGELNDSLTLDGKYICFYNESTISFIGKWINGKRDSIWTYYFRNGRKNIVQRFFDDDPMGDYHEYDSLGNLKVYCLQNEDAKCEYVIKFDEKGELISEEGSPWLVILKRHKPLLSVTDTVIGNIYVSTHNTFHVFAKSEEGMTISLVPFPGRSGLYILKIYFSEIGEVKGRLFIEGKGPQKSYRIFQPLTFTIVDD